jgi:hypothetical protein
MPYPISHGLEAAYHVVDDDNWIHPYFRCICGWESNREHRRWEAAGKEFDDHLGIPDQAVSAS